MDTTTRKTGLLKARVPGELAEAVEAMAETDRVPVSHVVREALEAHVARRTTSTEGDHHARTR